MATIRFDDDIDDTPHLDRQDRARLLMQLVAWVVVTAVVVPALWHLVLAYTLPANRARARIVAAYHRPPPIRKKDE